MTWKKALAKTFFYLGFVSLFVIFYVKDLVSDFIEGRSTMTSQYQSIDQIEFPTVTLCMVPGAKNSFLKKYGLAQLQQALKKPVTNKSMLALFNEGSYIEERDFDILDVTKSLIPLINMKALTYTTTPINTNHHGTCYKLQPVAPITQVPQYIALKITLKDISEEDKPTGVHVYLTSNKTWPNIANERWPQINPTKFFVEFKEKGLLKGLRLKLTEHIFQTESSDISECHRQLHLSKFNCTATCNFLSFSSLPNCNTTEDQKCAQKKKGEYPLEFENCFKVKQFLTYNPAIYDILNNPILNSSTIQFFMSIQDLQKEVKKEVKAITPESFIGSLGGSVGMFFGFSFTATILYAIQKIKQFYDQC